MTEAHTVLTNVSLGVDAFPLKQISHCADEECIFNSFLELLARVDYSEVWLQHCLGQLYLNKIRLKLMIVLVP